MNGIAHLQLDRLPESDISAAARLCARSMRDNPLHMRAFGADSSRRQRRLHRFLSTLIPPIHRRGMLIGAYADGTLAGILGLLPPATCRSMRVEMLQRLPSLLFSNSPIGTLRQWLWLSAWAQNEPREPHWHLGPLAVTPPLQAQGVGSRLMARGIVHMATHSALMYLETDNPANVTFYEQFGFSTLAMRPVLGTPTWFMARSLPESLS